MGREGSVDCVTKLILPLSTERPMGKVPKKSAAPRPKSSASQAAKGSKRTHTVNAKRTVRSASRKVKDNEEREHLDELHLQLQHQRPPENPVGTMVFFIPDQAHASCGLARRRHKRPRWPRPTPYVSCAASVRPSSCSRCPVALYYSFFSSSSLHGLARPARCVVSAGSTAHASAF